MEDEKFDRMFDEMFEAAVKEDVITEIPSPAVSWEKVRRQLEAEKRKRARRRRLTMVGVAAASLMIGAFLFGQPRATEAFQPFTKFIKGDVLAFFQGSKEPSDKGALTAPPPGPGSISSNGAQEGGAATEKLTATTFEEAQSLTSVPLFQPVQMPDDFKLKEIILTRRPDKKITESYYRYENAEGKFIGFQHFRMQSESVLTLNAGKDPDAVQEYKSDGKTVKVIRDDNGRQKVVWNIASGIVVLQGNADIELLKKLGIANN